VPALRIEPRPPLIGVLKLAELAEISATQIGMFRYAQLASTQSPDEIPPRRGADLRARSRSVARGDSHLGGAPLAAAARRLPRRATAEALALANAIEQKVLAQLTLRQRPACSPDQAWIGCLRPAQ
jgi:hypothetical protein